MGQKIKLNDLLQEFEQVVKGKVRYDNRYVEPYTHLLAQVRKLGEEQRLELLQQCLEKLYRVIRSAQGLQAIQCAYRRTALIGEIIYCCTSPKSLFILLEFCRKLAVLGLRKKGKKERKAQLKAVAEVLVSFLYHVVKMAEPGLRYFTRTCEQAFENDWDLQIVMVTALCDLANEMFREIYHINQHVEKSGYKPRSHTERLRYDRYKEKFYALAHEAHVVSSRILSKETTLTPSYERSGTLGSFYLATSWRLSQLYSLPFGRQKRWRGITEKHEFETPEYVE